MFKGELYPYTLLYINTAIPSVRYRMISYTPLFETMKRKGITSYRLEKAGFSRATYYSIRHGNSISTNTINQLCKILDCTTSEIIEYIPDD